MKELLNNSEDRKEESREGKKNNHQNANLEMLRLVLSYPLLASFLVPRRTAHCITASEKEQ